MSYNEYYQLVQAGVKITDKNVYRFCDHGYNVQEDGVYMSRGYYETHKEQAHRFAQASRKGWEWAAQHPEEALEIVMQYIDHEHIATNQVMQRLMLKEVLRLQVDRESKKREFRLRPDMVQLANELMIENKMLSREVPYEELIPQK
jgi:NitT/TauT family transport system substrate-binding protein